MSLSLSLGCLVSIVSIDFDIDLHCVDVVQCHWSCWLGYCYSYCNHIGFVHWWRRGNCRNLPAAVVGDPTTSGKVIIYHGSWRCVHHFGRIGEVGKDWHGGSRH